jgi:flagellar basal-body rod modification protein FlgD
MSINPIGSTAQTNPAAIGAAASSSTAAGSSTAANSSAAASIGGLTMNNFLTLMTAQLKNQDPLKPTDSNEFLQQLSGLSTVEGISQLNTSLTTLSNSMLSSQALTSASLVGKGILAPASSAYYSSGQAMTGAVQVPSGASNVVLSITNSGGALVDQISVPAGAGLQSFSWGGTSSNGQAAPSGSYSIAAYAQVGGKAQSANTLISGTVTSVTLGAAGVSPTLNTSQLGPVALSAVQQID